MFYFLWLCTFLSAYVATQKTGFFPEYIIESAALYFFVFLIAIPPTLYSIVKGFYNNYTELHFERHAYIALGLFFLNTFCLLYSHFGNVSTVTSEIIENVVTYVNYFVILLLFPLSTLFYLYYSIKIIVRQNDKKFYTSSPFLLVVLFLSFIICLFLSQIKIVSFAPLFFLIYATVFFVAIGYVFLIFGRKDKLETVVFDEVLISDKAIKEINTMLLQKMEQEKLFLDPNLSVSTLAKELKTNTKYLSYVINLVHGVNFSTFVNSYRIDEAKQLLLQKETANYTIETIANMAGFYSKSSFNSVFKKAVGKTPSEFIKLSF